MKRDYILKPNVISYTAAISACGKVMQQVFANLMKRYYKKNLKKALYRNLFYEAVTQQELR
jgi:hypothetical protein